MKVGKLVNKMKDADSKITEAQGVFISKKPSGIALDIQVFQCMLHHNHHHIHHQHHPSGTRQRAPTSYTAGEMQYLN